MGWHVVIAVLVKVLLEGDELVRREMILEDDFAGDEVFIRNPARHVIASGGMLRDVLVEANAHAREKIV